MYYVVFIIHGGKYYGCMHSNIKNEWVLQVSRGCWWAVRSDPYCSCNGQLPIKGCALPLLPHHSFTPTGDYWSGAKYMYIHHAVLPHTLTHAHTHTCTSSIHTITNAHHYSTAYSMQGLLVWGRGKKKQNSWKYDLQHFYYTTVLETV